MDSSILVALISAIIGGVLGSFLESLMNYRKEFSTKIWNKRFECYQKLWQITGKLSLYPKNEKFTYGGLQKMNIEMKNWYFEEGGILLSNKSTSRYKEAKKMMQKLVDKNKKDILDTSDYNIIQNECSKLRSSLTDDLLSRKRQRLLN